MRYNTACLILVFAAGCSGDSQAPESGPASIFLDRTEATLAVSGKIQLNATGSDGSGGAVGNASVTWASSTPAVAVSSQGLVTAQAPGSAIITATISSPRGQVTAAASITVLDGAPGQTTVTPNNAAVLVGQTVTLAFRSFDGAGVLVQSASPTWTSSNSAVARVDANGVVTGVSLGNASIRATADGKSSAADITVSPPADMASISASKTDVCAVTSTGALYCAGKNYGPTPRAVAPQLRFKAVKGFGSRATNNSGFCALAMDDTAYCWGSNELGQLGVGDNTDRQQPTLVSGGLKFKSISPGDLLTCALSLDGVGYCWGGGASGAIGDGSTANRYVPTRVKLNDPIQQIAAGNHSEGGVNGPNGYACALTTAGKLYCWGGNTTAQLGNGKVPVNSTEPQPAATDQTFKTLPDNLTLFACAATIDDDALCWGNGNPLGVSNLCPFPQGVHPCLPVPTPFAPGLKFTAMTASVNGGMCALTRERAVKCWGLNINNRFAATCNGNCPTPVGTLTGFISISSSVFTTCGIAEDRRAYCWGDNSSAQFADAQITISEQPVMFRVPRTP